MGTDVGPPNGVPPERLVSDGVRAEAGEPRDRANSADDGQVDRSLPSAAVAGGNPHTTPEIDQKLEGTRPGEFAADVAELEALVELVTAHGRNFDWQSHPIFGRMSEAALAPLGLPAHGPPSSAVRCVGVEPQSRRPRPWF